MVSFLKHNASNQNRKNAVIIGGGISGLTSALQLTRAGIEVTLLEQSVNLGGCIKTLKESGYILELGPNTFLNSSTELWRLADSVGLRDEKLETPKKVGKTRYIFKNNKLLKVPAGPNILFSPVLSFKGKLRLLKEPFVKPIQDENESLASFIKRRLGEDVLNNLVTPFISGIYAGDPEQLNFSSVFPKLALIEKKHGSIIKGMSALKPHIKSSGLGSFKDGIGRLTTAIEERLNCRIVKKAKVISVEAINNKFRIVYETTEGTKIILADSVIIATPSYVAAKLLSGINENFKTALSEIEYAPVTVVHTGFKEKDIPKKLDGFGFLVPRKNMVRMLGSLWSSALFQKRAPDGYHLLTNFIGGMLDKEAFSLSNDDIFRMVQTDLAKTMGIKKEPSFACITKYANAIPQLGLNHPKRMELLNRTLDHYSGLFVAGSYIDGVSVASAIENANKTSSKAIKFLNSRVF